MTKTEEKNTVASKDIDLISDLVKGITGLDIYQDTRKRPYVEARALFFYILKEDYGTTFKFIQDHMESKGNWFHHASLLHAVDNFQYYAKFNKKLFRARDYILNKMIEIKYSYEQIKNIE